MHNLFLSGNLYNYLSFAICYLLTLQIWENPVISHMLFVVLKITSGMACAGPQTGKN